MSETLSLAGEVIVAASLILIGLLIGAQILGFAVPFAGYILVAAAAVVVTGIALMIYSLIAEGQSKA
jgi:hypothetical protein